MLETGLTAQSVCSVNGLVTAEVFGSGDMPVFATPAMIAVMENAAMKVVADHLESGMSTVGTELRVSHLRASGVGEKVTATATLINIEGRKLTFKVSAADSQGVIGEGEHERFIVEKERFLNKIKK